jgi:hypothetical protein
MWKIRPSSRARYQSRVRGEERVWCCTAKAGAIALRCVAMDGIHTTVACLLQRGVLELLTRC